MDVAQIDLIPVVFGEGDGGVAAIFASRFDRFFNAGTCGKHRAVGDFEVSDDTGLSSHHDIFACSDGAGDAGL